MEPLIVIGILCGLTVHHATAEQASELLLKQYNEKAYVFNLTKDKEFDYVEFEVLTPCLKNQMKEGGVR